MKKNFLVSMIALISAIALLVACDSGSSNGETADPEDLTGTWLATGDDEGTGKAMLFEITATEFRRIAYTESTEGMMQDEGSLGTWEVSGSDFVVSITHEWDDESQQWGELESESEVTVSYSLDGTTLTMDIPGMGEISFTEKNFVQDADLADTTWSFGSDLLTFHADGSYTYDSDDYPSTGTWEATEDLLRYITTEEKGDALYYEILYEYALEENYLVFFWDGDELYRCPKAD